MNDTELIRNLEPYMPLHIEMQCHRGHFIANMTLSVRNGVLMLRREHSGYELRRRASQDKGVLYGDVHVTPTRALCWPAREAIASTAPNAPGTASPPAAYALRAGLTTGLR